MSVTVIAIRCALSVSQGSYRHFLKVTGPILFGNTTIDLRRLTQRTFIMLYPQNGVSVVTIDSVTSLHPIYNTLDEFQSKLKTASGRSREVPAGKAVVYTKKTTNIN